MPDYMYLLESRLSPEQRAVLERVQELARAQSANVYLTGGAIRDLISGMPIRDLDFTVEGSPFKIVRELEKGGARAIYEDERLRHIEIILPATWMDRSPRRATNSTTGRERSRKSGGPQ